MKKTLWLLVSLALRVPAQEATPDINQVLEVLRNHIAKLETSVPNFICKEQIISRFYVNDKVKKETRAESILTTTRTVKEGHGTFSETRADMSINGKPTKRDDISGPFVWKGGPAYADLHYLFNSPHGMECRTYRLMGRVQLDSRDVFLLQAHAATGEQDACRDLPADSADKAWLEPKSLNVVRIESFDPPTTGDQLGMEGANLTLTVDYAPVVFDGVEYWLPSHFISRLDFPGTPRRYQYEAFFTGYHKYGAESVFHVDAEQ